MKKPKSKGVRPAICNLLAMTYELQLRSAIADCRSDPFTPLFVPSLIGRPVPKDYKALLYPPITKNKESEIQLHVTQPGKHSRISKRSAFQNCSHWNGIKLSCYIREANDLMVKDNLKIISTVAT